MCLCSVLLKILRSKTTYSTTVREKNNDLIGEFRSLLMLAALRCLVCSSHCSMVGGTCLCVSACLLTRLTQIRTATRADLVMLGHPDTDLENSHAQFPGYTSYILHGKITPTRENISPILKISRNFPVHYSE